MSELIAAPGINAGRQTAAHEQLSRALWMRKVGDVFRFVLDPAAPPGLTLERIGQARGTILARVAAARAEGRKLDSGLVLVDGRDGLAFFTTTDPMAFLRRLAAWAQGAIHETPALGLLVDSGAGPLTIDLADDDAARAYLPDGAGVVYDAALWDALLEPDAATLAAALAAATPGERLWFWLAEDETEGALPLIVQPVAWDPNHDRSSWLVDRNTDRGAGDGVTGTATVCDDGTIQFIGAGLYPYMLEQLARWVHKNHAANPALLRLVDCQLLTSSDGAIEEIIADPSLWTGLIRDAVPMTLLATALTLQALTLQAPSAGGDCWFWITGGPTSPPFLHLLPTDTDPDGLAFRASLPELYKRFDLSYRDAITGVLSRTADGQLLFASQDRRVRHFSEQVQALLDRYGAAFPALVTLAGASLIQIEGDGQAGAVVAPLVRS